MTTDKTYNGWTNYETWVVNLWLNNDEGSQRYWGEQAEHLKQSAENHDTAVQDLAEVMKGHFEESGHNILEIAKATSSVWADLLGAALSEVNWREIAEHKLEE